MIVWFCLELVDFPQCMRLLFHPSMLLLLLFCKACCANVFFELPTGEELITVTKSSWTELFLDLKSTTCGLGKFLNNNEQNHFS